MLLNKAELLEKYYTRGNPIDDADVDLLPFPGRIPGVLDISAVCRLCFQENHKTAQDLK